MTTSTIIIVCLAGAYTLAGAIFDWDWLMNRRGNSVLTSLLGRTGARIFFGILGVALIGLGMYFAFNPAQA